MQYGKMGAAWRRLAMGATLTLATLGLGGCASFYVDTATQDVMIGEYKQPAKPKPAQVVFEFQTKGAPNAGATDLLKQTVMDQVRTSGIFADLSEKPAAGVPILSVVINNIPITEDAMSKGFATGLTFGLAGSVVTDGYLCKVSYLPTGAIEPVSATARHAIHTSLGNAAAPAGAVKSESMLAAAKQMARQIVANALLDLSLEPGFQEATR